MRKYLTLIVVPHDNANVRNIKISYLMMYGFGVIVVLCVLAVAALVTTYGSLLVKAHRADELAAENAEFVEQRAQIDSLQMELVRMQALGLQIKNMLGVELTAADSALVANWAPSARAPAISGALESAEQVRDERVSLLKAIPSMWPIRGYVTKEFDIAGGENRERYHPGMDIAATRNTPVRASADGVVNTSGWDETYGYLVVIDHGFGISTVYGHNSRNLVKVGDRVTRGQTIAFLGSTGRSTAPHLHFEVRKNAVPENPRKYLLD
ncbi:MAG: zinc metalloendopeptidase, family [Candidatus Krumholzibacteriota bacterium]|jgi:murein DD-endopeptidase MepM/ murein hydrolase activator NlpD|nr:zinc metalloendopeptidase, family [Candidatus Krumholzibacteriota bacterium]